MEKITINEHAHLGDTLVILTLAQNRAVKNNWIIKIYGKETIQNLFEIFDFTHLVYVKKREAKNNCSIVKLMPYKEYGIITRNKANETFLKLNQFELIQKENAEKISKIILPKTKLEKTTDENISYFQFDTRSIYDSKKLLNKEEINYIINNFKKETTPIGIGGKETIKYSDHEYKLGNISEIAQNLLNGKRFIGIDSGISHVAGMLNIKSHIVISTSNKKHIEELTEFYNIFYPNTTCYSRDDIKKFKFFKMI